MGSIEGFANQIHLFSSPPEVGVRAEGGRGSRTQVSARERFVVCEDTEWASPVGDMGETSTESVIPIRCFPDVCECLDVHRYLAIADV